MRLSILILNVYNYNDSIILLVWNFHLYQTAAIIHLYGILFPIKQHKGKATKMYYQSNALFLSQEKK